MGAVRRGWSLIQCSLVLWPLMLVTPATSSQILSFSSRSAVGLNNQRGKWTSKFQRTSKRNSGWWTESETRNLKPFFIA